MLASLAACTPQSYQVNPQPDASSDSNQVPESQSKDYMRIIGDLRWDKLTSPKDWESRFPGCLDEQKRPALQTGDGSPYLLATGRDANGYSQSPNPKCGFAVGGLQFSLYEVSLEKDPTGKRSFRTQRVGFLKQREDQSRAFKAAIAEKYSSTDDGICSKYTCITESYYVFDFSPTPYTTSILDSVKVDPSAF